jgi:predicted O-methyltransferase YrrM
MTDQEVLKLCLPISGWMYPAELLWLYRQAEGRRVIVEIGVWEGRSTAALASGTSGVVYAIDHWRGSPEERRTFHALVQSRKGRQVVKEKAQTNLAPFIARGRCQLIDNDSRHAASRFATGAIDMFFLDGGHDYDSVRRDLAAYLPRMAPRGLVCGHDWKQHSVRQAVYERFENRVRRGPGSLWYVEEHDE